MINIIDGDKSVGQMMEKVIEAQKFENENVR
jgi:hypothetical protein